MGVLEENRPQVTSKSASNVAVQKSSSQTKAPEKSKASERTHEKVCVFYHRNTSV
jgi:hypothetical protein